MLFKWKNWYEGPDFHEPNIKEGTGQFYLALYFYLNVNAYITVICKTTLILKPGTIMVAIKEQNMFYRMEFKNFLHD